jgi:hypothetical protein
MPLQLGWKGMKVLPFVAGLLLVLAVAGCRSSTPYDATADRAAIQEAIRSAWSAESAGDESTACLYYTKTFIEEQNRVWEGDDFPHRTDCATGGTGSHPYLRLTSEQGESGSERVRFAWTRVFHKSRTATAQPILPGGLRCLNPVDCHVVISLVIHLVDEQNGRWLIDDLDASACEVHGSCVPLDNTQVM